MRHILPITLFLIFVVLLGGCEKKEQDILYDRKYIDEIKQIRKDAGFYLARNFIPGGTFAIAKDGKIIYSEGLGMASQDLNIKMSRKHKLRIGDVSEVYTSLIYKKLEQEGILHPDSSITSYLPKFPGFNYDVKIKHLVDHSSGIRPLNDVEEEERAFNVSLQSGIKKLEGMELYTPPGAMQDISAFNYNLLGAAMEKATGKRFSQLIKEYVTDTLNLSNTTIDNPFLTIEGRVDFFDHNLVAQCVNASTIDLRFRGPSQGILSNAEDLVQFGNAILHSDYISKELRDSMFTRPVLLDGVEGNMANGWILFFDAAGRKVYGRAGKVVGGGAAIIIYPDYDLVVAGAVNLTMNLDEIPVFEFAKHFLPEEEIEQATEQNESEK